MVLNGHRNEGMLQSRDWTVSKDCRHGERNWDFMYGIRGVDDEKIVRLGEIEQCVIKK